MMKPQMIDIDTWVYEYRRKRRRYSVLRAVGYPTAVLLGAWTPGGGPYTLSASYGAEFQRGLITRSLYVDDQVTRQTFRLNVTIAPRLSRRFRPTGEPPVVHPQGVPQ